MEHIAGPYQGFYIATYACETGAPGAPYLGYTKICRRKPASYWDAQCLVKLCGEGLHSTAAAAVADAERRARNELSYLEDLCFDLETATDNALH